MIAIIFLFWSVSLIDIMNDIIAFIDNYFISR